MVDVNVSRQIHHIADGFTRVRFETGDHRTRNGIGHVEFRVFGVLVKKFRKNM